MQRTKIRKCSRCGKNSSPFAIVFHLKHSLKQKKCSPVLNRLTKLGGDQNRRPYLNRVGDDCFREQLVALPSGPETDWHRCRQFYIDSNYLRRRDPFSHCAIPAARSFRGESSELGTSRNWQLDFRVR